MGAKRAAQAGLVLRIVKVFSGYRCAGLGAQCIGWLHHLTVVPAPDQFGPHKRLRLRQREAALDGLSLALHKLGKGRLVLRYFAKGGKAAVFEKGRQFGRLLGDWQPAGSRALCRQPPGVDPRVVLVAQHEFAQAMAVPAVVGPVSRAWRLGQDDRLRQAIEQIEVQPPLLRVGAEVCAVMGCPVVMPAMPASAARHFAEPLLGLLKLRCGVGMQHQQQVAGGGLKTRLPQGWLAAVGIAEMDLGAAMGALHKSRRFGAQQVELARIEPQPE